ncbi:MAG: NAD(P)H-hydrate dehydratase [Hyphomicrobiaceae bacterium]
MAINSNAGLELLTTDEMGRADRLAVESGVASLELMERAGRAVADEGQRMVPAGSRIVVLCGAGNNGGDGFVAARLLALRGFDVHVACVIDPSRLTGDAGEMARRWAGTVAGAGEGEANMAQADLIVDALLGAGLDRPLDGVIKDWVTSVNALSGTTTGPCVLSVDVPTGLNGSTGEIAGGSGSGQVIRATRTVTFFRGKPGHVLLPGRSYCGDVSVVDIGIPAETLQRINPLCWINQPSLWCGAFPVASPDAHKYRRGHAIVVSGPAEKTGAARLGARGALRTGAGLVTVASPRAAFPVNAAQLTAIMVEPFTVPEGLAGTLADERRNAVLIGPGCGVGEATRRMVEIGLASRAAVVLDADALTSFEAMPSALFALIGARGQGAAGGREAKVILTPHEGEFKRLFPDLAGSKLERARAAAARAGAVVVLKGPDSVIAAADGRAAINANAPPSLATAGSGDVLAGFMTGLLAQGMPAFDAACAAVWLHGACASAFGWGLIAEDLPEMMPHVLKHLLSLRG